MIPIQLSLVEQFYKGRQFELVFLIFVAVLAYVSYYLGKRGRVPEIRPIEALDAIYEGIGRCAEMGRPIMILPGLGGLTSTPTLSGLTLFGDVAQRGAEIGVDTYLSASSTDVIAFSEAIVKNAYDRAGKSERYVPGEYVRWFGGDQYAYAVGTAGQILAIKPGMLILMGYFMSDVVVSMETGSRVGAQLIGGCLDALPEMSVFSDFLMIGEEIFAASAMISKNNMVIGTLAGQDWLKLISVVLMIAGVILMMANNRILLNIMGW
jgi:hypothetical protein